MSDEQDLSNDERKLEAALARLKPRHSELNAVAIAYEAGRRSAAWRLTTWRAVAALLLLAITLVTLLRPAPRTVEKLVFVPARVSRPLPITMTFPPSSSMPPASPSGAPLSYLTLRQNVIQYGPDALPASPPAADGQQSGTQLGSWRSQFGDKL